MRAAAFDCGVALLLFTGAEQRATLLEPALRVVVDACLEALDAGGAGANGVLDRVGATLPLLLTNIHKCAALLNPTQHPYSTPLLNTLINILLRRHLNASLSPATLPLPCRQAHGLAWPVRRSPSISHDLL